MLPASPGRSHWCQLPLLHDLPSGYAVLGQGKPWRALHRCASLGVGGTPEESILEAVLRTLFVRNGSISISKVDEPPAPAHRLCACGDTDLLCPFLHAGCVSKDAEYRLPTCATDLVQPQAACGRLGRGLPLLPFHRGKIELCGDSSGPNLHELSPVHQDGKSAPCDSSRECGVG